MKMTEIGEDDRKVDNDECKHGELDRKYNKYYNNDEHEWVNMTENRKYNLKFWSSSNVNVRHCHFYSVKI